MHLPLLLEVAASAMPDRVGVVAGSTQLTYAELSTRSARAAGVFGASGAERIVLVDVNTEAVPIALYGAALANIAFVPVSYRLADDQLRSIVRRCAPALVIAGPGVAERLAGVEQITVLERSEFLQHSASSATATGTGGAETDPESVAVLLYTSGTSGDPKAAVLRHAHLASYILDSVELAGAAETEAALVSVPAYHIAGVSAVLSSSYAGRRLVYLETFDPELWVEAAEREQITHAMVVPTMLGRILDVLQRRGHSLPSLGSLSYGGGRMPLPVIERAMRLLPTVGFVNAYGLTETASTIALLGPDDHRQAAGSDLASVRRRLASVGRPLPSVEIEIRDRDGHPLDAGLVGEIWVRGAQVSGEYVGRERAEHAWFNTRDSGEFDDAGYLYVHGRLDDVIVRGGENLSPGEIEAVLVRHPAVDQAAVVGIPDVEWGERVVAAVTLRDGRQVEESELRELVRGELRSARTPERIEFRHELPTTETGKLLRRVLRTELAATFSEAAVPRA